MVTDLFGAILQELGKSMGDIPLQPDQNNSCLIKLKDSPSIQLELDRSGNFIVLGCNLGTVPAGKYRENLFREALKANDLPPPLNGVLGFSQKTGHLILFEKINVQQLNGEKIAAEITPFMEKAKRWAEALKNNDIPVVNQAYTSGGMNNGMFGLRP